MGKGDRCGAARALVGGGHQRWRVVGDLDAKAKSREQLCAVERRRAGRVVEEGGVAREERVDMVAGRDGLRVRGGPRAPSSRFPRASTPHRLEVCGTKIPRQVLLQPRHLSFVW